MAESILVHWHFLSCCLRAAKYGITGYEDVSFIAMTLFFLYSRGSLVTFYFFLLDK